MTACPHPEKLRHRSKGSAIAHIRSLYREGKGNPDLTPYRCVCGAWHVGHDARHFGKRIKIALKGRRKARR